MLPRHQHILLFVLLCASLLVYFLNEIAQVNFFYWTYWWYDIMMHFLGGFVVSGVGLWMFTRFAPVSVMHVQNILYVAIGTGLLIGISWEFFEYFNGMYAGQSSIFVDTITDLIMDFEGAAVMGLIVHSMLAQGSRTA